MTSRATQWLLTGIYALGGVPGGASPLEAPLFRAVATAQGNVGAGGTLVVNKPTGTVDGDLMLLQATTSSTVAYTPPGGWTEVATMNETGGGAGNKITVYKRTASGEGASYTFTVGAFNVLSLGIISWYSNTGRTLVASDTPTTQSNDTLSTSQDAPSMTTTIVNSILHCFYTISTTSVAGTPHTGMDERWESPGSTADYLMTATIAAAGATGIRTMTHGGNQTSASISLAVAESL